MKLYWSKDSPLRNQVSRLPAEQVKDKADFRALRPWHKATPKTGQFSERVMNRMVIEESEIRGARWKRHQTKKGY